VGLTLGQAFRDALGDKAGIRRFGEGTVPLDEALVSVVVDLSGRPYLVYDVPIAQAKIGTFDADLVNDFLQALTTQIGMNLHVTCQRGRNPHHIVEATFKGLARALDAATRHDPRVEGVLSTKGVL
jgi:imidazoleglycerol-phosphate dehydratase